MTTSSPFRFQLLPEPAQVAEDRTIGEVVAKLGNGVHEVARDDRSVLWAEIADGRPVDFRGFDIESGREIGVVIFIEPDPQVGPPTRDNLRPPWKGETGEASAVLRARADGGVYVCTANGDGGYTCWKM